MSLALLALQAEHASRTPLWVVAGYFVLLIGLGLVARGMFRGTSGDYYVASRSIGPFLLLSYFLKASCLAELSCMAPIVT